MLSCGDLPISLMREREHREWERRYFGPLRIFDMMWPIYISYFTARLMDPGFFSIVGIVGCAHLDTGYPRRSLSGSRKTSAWRASRIFIIILNRSTVQDSLSFRLALALCIRGCGIRSFELRKPLTSRWI